MENTFDVKWYTDSSLVYWVEEKILPTERFQFDQVVEDHKDDIVEFDEKLVDFSRTIRWVMFTWGWVIETCYCDDTGITTVETLLSYDGKTATIIHRSRFGANYHKSILYSRDYVFPVPSVVRLSSCSL